MRIETPTFVTNRVFRCRDRLPSIVIAIPACNEAGSVAQCLRAIDRCASSARQGSPSVGVVCLVNNSSDATFEMACREAADLSIALRVVDVSLSPASSNAGSARRIAMDLAAEWLEEGGHRGVLLTTDADSEPAADWIAAIQSALAGGADAVAGTIGLFANDVAALPHHIHARGALEAEYETLLTEMFARLDPRAHDPWPCHQTNAGANLAVTLRAYRAIGGLPLQPCGEDKALVARLDREGYYVRHDLAVRVDTSGRLEGRATGGVADTIRLRCVEPEASCDEYLEPALNARFRGFWRGRLRTIYSQRGVAPALAAFGWPMSSTLASRTFGSLWDGLEQEDARLSRQLLRPADLPHEIAAARVVLRHLRHAPISVARKDRADNPHSAPAE